MRKETSQLLRDKAYIPVHAVHEVYTERERRSNVCTCDVYIGAHSPREKLVLEGTRHTWACEAPGAHESKGNESFKKGPARAGKGTRRVEEAEKGGGDHPRVF